MPLTITNRRLFLTAQSLMVSASLTLLSPPTLATGIPVVDVASMVQFAAEATTRAAEFAEDITEARKRLSELKSQGAHYKRMVEGHVDFEDVLYDPTLNSVYSLKDWRTIYNNIEDIADLRQEFDMYSDDPMVQRSYDRQLKEYKMKTIFYENSVKRNENMASLMTQYQSATTPATKADLANAIAFEQTQIQNDAQMQQTLQTVMEEQRINEAQASMRATYDTLMGEGIPRL